MIELDNGDLWLVRDDELRGEHPPEIRKVEFHPFPTLKRETPREACDAYSTRGQYFYPLRWRSLGGGRWDRVAAEELFEALCQASVENAWSKAYLMPWGHVFVFYETSDGYDPSYEFTRYDTYDDYKNAVLFRSLEG